MRIFGIPVGEEKRRIMEAEHKKAEIELWRYRVEHAHKDWIYEAIIASKPTYVYGNHNLYNIRWKGKKEVVYPEVVEFIKERQRTIEWEEKRAKKSIQPTIGSYDYWY